MLSSSVSRFVNRFRLSCGVPRDQAYQVRRARFSRELAKGL
jgi:hypothetical protein